MALSAEEKQEVDALFERDNRVRTSAISEIRRALEVFGGSATALAKAAGVSPSTITRPLKDPRNASLPKWATIVKILEAAALSPKSYGGPTSAPNNFQLVEVVGELRPGVWFKNADERDYGPNIFMVMDGYRPQGSLSAFVVGPEGIPYPPGTRAIVDSGRAPDAGDHVVFRRVDSDEKTETFSALFSPMGTVPTYFEFGIDGTSQRHRLNPFSTEESPLGVMLGPVIATVWIKA